MSDDWLDELRQLHEEDKVRRQAEVEPLDLNFLAAQRNQQAADLLRQVDAHNLLRQVQKALLGGKGTIVILRQAKNYDSAIGLTWQGSFSIARKPDQKNAEVYNFILIGVYHGKLYVNSQEVEPATTAAVKDALLKAAKNPAQTSKPIQEL